MKYIYGPVPSRRLGLSLGISPIPKKTCNYACVYCQLGKTDHMTNKRQSFYPLESILNEFDSIQNTNIVYDVVTIVGEGEPTLYKDLEGLILGLKERTHKPIAVITNGALLYDEEVRKALYQADIVLPSMDAYDEKTFNRINRPHGGLTYALIEEGLALFSKYYQGQLWLEIMLMKDLNDDDFSIQMYKEKLAHIRYDKLYLNTPVRPPAEKDIKPVTHEVMEKCSQALNGISIDLLASEGFQSDITNHLDAILSIIKRHPMNQHEIKAFLTHRKCEHIEDILKELDQHNQVEHISYRDYVTYRLKS